MSRSLKNKHITNTDTKFIGTDLPSSITPAFKNYDMACGNMGSVCRVFHV